MSLLEVISGFTQPILKICLPIDSHVICECHRRYMNLKYDNIISNLKCKSEGNGRTKMFLTNAAKTMIEL